jgi:Epoxide hydrolase N terminus
MSTIATQHDDARQQTSSDPTAIRPFQISFPEAQLTELRTRVLATRWPERETVADDSQGVPRGGPFAAWEQPQLFAEEMRAAFGSLR